MVDMLDKTTTFNLLYDFYRPLLSETQRMFLELYYVEDWSLSEIAEHFSISRQAVHDRIKRVEKALTGFEEKLHLAEKHERRKKLVREMKQKFQAQCEFSNVERLLDQLLEID